MKTIVKVCLAERSKRKTKFFWRAIEKSHSASLAVSPIARMKRSMAQVTQCVVCLQPVKKGWGQLNRKKFCMGAPAMNKGSTTKKTDIRVDTEDDNNHKQHEKEIDGHDEAQDSGLDFGYKMAPYEGVALLNDETITAEPIYVLFDLSFDFCLPLNVPLDVPLDVSLDVIFEVLFDVLFDVIFDVLFDVLFDVRFYVSFDLSFDFCLPLNLPLDVPLDVSLDVIFEVLFDVLFDVIFDVLFDVLFDVRFYVPFDLSFDFCLLSLY